MTAIASSGAARAAVAVALLLALAPAVVQLSAEEPTLRLRASAVGGDPAPWTIDLLRWSTEAERAPLLAALAPPPPAPPAAAPAPDRAGGPAGRGGRAAPAGRGGRGGRGAAAPPSPFARLTSAVKAAPTLGFIWGAGVTGYSIKYAWRGMSLEGGAERIVLVTDRRVGPQAQDSPPSADPAADAEFTVIEIRLDAKGAGEGKTSLTAKVVVDPAAPTLALDGYQAAPALLKVTR